MAKQYRLIVEKRENIGKLGTKILRLHFVRQIGFEQGELSLDALYNTSISIKTAYQPTLYTRFYNKPPYNIYELNMCARKNNQSQQFPQMIILYERNNQIIKLIAFIVSCKYAENPLAQATHPRGGLVRGSDLKDAARAVPHAHVMNVLYILYCLT